VISSFGVILDACVLVPISLCDILLSAADRRLYRPLWSAAILDETERALIRNGLTEAQAVYRRAEMQAAYPDAAVTGYESIVDAMQNHAKDRHVLAAAVRSSAQVIVTANIKDFPEEVLRPLGIEPKTPDDFLMDLLGFDEKEVLDAVKQMAAQKKKPPLTPLDMLRRIGKSSPNFAAAALLMIEAGDECTELRRLG
jgi:hypothetical protein